MLRTLLGLAFFDYLFFLSAFHHEVVDKRALHEPGPFLIVRVDLPRGFSRCNTLFLSTILNSIEEVIDIFALLGLCIRKAIWGLARETLSLVDVPLLSSLGEVYCYFLDSVFEWSLLGAIHQVYRALFFHNLSHWGFSFLQMMEVLDTLAVEVL